MKLNDIEMTLLDKLLPTVNAYDKGFRDCLESVLLAMRGNGITVTSVLIDTVMDAYVNNEAATPEPALDTREVAMAAAFMWQGAFVHWDKMQESRAPGDTAQTSWVAAITRHAERCEQRWLAYLKESDGCIDAVWSYEVCEPYGAELVLFMLKHGRSPTESEADSLLEAIVHPIFYGEALAGGE